MTTKNAQQLIDEIDNNRYVDLTDLKSEVFDLESVKEIVGKVCLNCFYADWIKDKSTACYVIEREIKEGFNRKWN